MALMRMPWTCVAACVDSVAVGLGRPSWAGPGEVACLLPQKRRGCGGSPGRYALCAEQILTTTVTHGRPGREQVDCALRWGRAAVTCVPLEHKADAIAQDKDGLTPSRMALGGRHGKAAHLLLRNGADEGAHCHSKHSSIVIISRLL